LANIVQPGKAGKTKPAAPSACAAMRAMELSRLLDRMVVMGNRQSCAVVLSQDNRTLTRADEFEGLSDRELVAALDVAAAGERATLVATLKFLSEVERRGVHRDMGYRTIFDYCVLRLKMSEGAAMRRIYSARSAAKLPALYERLRTGALSLSSVSRLAPHLTAQNSQSLIARASGARLREVETIVAELLVKESRPLPATEPPQAELIFACVAVAAGTQSARADEKTAAHDCRMPEEPTPLSSPPQRPKRDSIHVESPGVLRIVFRASLAFREKLELASRLLGRRADGRLETVIELVLDRFLDKEDPFRRKAGKRCSPSPRARRAARWLRDAVWRRDGGRCAFISEDGVRCEARSKLEYDHILPWAQGGSSADPANIRLLCRAHNLHLARKSFGERVPAPRSG
jgi:hypothetical protein